MPITGEMSLPRARIACAYLPGTSKLGRVQVAE